ncbi:type I-C CRISPR-associated protein Cas8c/Csd1 [Niveispirillum sp. SYP-B3756]|uniref:type I-C CRISPR-associated protein Cas8c/Csd1 n=1 Tax=Niveispirillum sp. SYP-B3756 TaxID=2662178 RepID=UPI0012911226|nr:type I-C CRISPR-associated protein Cas8c/Csd1 [Niveispirillum sp. SYP-B3756]MQP68152.1 type I-C CRISPR-associated protein Cas8c/Csd1 [Niveispirillum sp. SYP-B3756]
MTILMALNRHYDRLLAEGAAPPFGFTTEGIGFCLVLNRDGTLSRPPDDLRGTDKKRPPTPLPVPASFKRPGVTPRAFFLWDNTKFVLGLGKDKASGGLAPYPTHLAAFREKHEAALGQSDDPGLQALLAFLRAWNPDAFTDQGWDTEILDQNIVFALDEDYPGQFLHERSAAQEIWRRELAATASDKQMCLVTGEQAPAARLHPAIKGVWGAQSSGASLVSFNLDAFTSYAKEQGGNAPVSEAAAFGYGTALNALLAKGSDNRVQVGDTSVAFWADASGIAAAREAEALAGAALAPRFADEDDDIPSDGQEARKVGDALENLAKGMPVERASVTVDPATRFYILGLAPNAARLSVRLFQEMTLGGFATALRWHSRDLRLDPPAWKGEPKLQALLYQTAVQDKAENIQPLLGGELMRAVLNPNCRYPRTLLSAVLQRIRADGEIRPARAAIIKAWLARDARIAAPEKHETPEKEELYVSLDREETNAAYRLGRLFAMLESIQYRALGSVNASIGDRYFGAASATPSAVFPLLLRGSKHHLSVLRKKHETKRLAGWFEGQVGEIMDGLATTLPRHFGLEDQGRFVVGYYHQRNERSAKAGEEAGNQGQED